MHSPSPSTRRSSAGASADAGDLRPGRLALLVAAAGLLAAAHLSLRPELPWVAEEPDELGGCLLAEETGGDEAADAPPTWGPVDVDSIPSVDAIALLGRRGVTFVDARPRGRFAEGHVPGALCLPADEAPILIGHSSLPIDPAGRVVAYCEDADPSDAQAVAALLRDRLDCASVAVVRGGWRRWLADGGPSERGPGHG